MSKRVFITVAEHSADKHAGRFARALRDRLPGVQIDALGGAELARAGAAVHHDTVDRAAMGLAAVFRAREVMRLVKLVRARYTDPATRPDLHVCCDSWSMNWHFAKLAKEFDVPTLYYIAPQTWASRESRLKKMRRYIDRVACILPFEQEYFTRHGLSATFVGHPLFDELPPERATRLETERHPARPPVIGLLPGSRRSIANANVPRLVEVAQAIRTAFPDARFVIPTTASTHDVVAKWVSAASWIDFARDQFDAMVPSCDLCVTVSGTAALHVAALDVPLVVVYHGNPILWHLVGRWIIKTRTYSLVNLLSDFHTHIVPEYIPWYGPTKPVSDLVIDLLNHPDKLRAQRKALRKMIHTLNHPGASDNVARMAMEILTTVSAQSP